MPIREDAPTRIFFFIEDLFFLAKIQETAKKLGVKVGFLKADKDIVARLSGVPDSLKALADRLRSEQCRRQAADPDPQDQGQAEARNFSDRVPLPSAGRPEGEGDRGRAATW